MLNNRRPGLFILVFCAAALAACGGGGDWPVLQPDSRFEEPERDRSFTPQPATIERVPVFDDSAPIADTMSQLVTRLHQHIEDFEHLRQETDRRRQAYETLRQAAAAGDNGALNNAQVALGQLNRSLGDLDGLRSRIARDAASASRLIARGERSEPEKQDLARTLGDIGALSVQAESLYINGTAYTLAQVSALAYLRHGAQAAIAGRTPLLIARFPLERSDLEQAMGDVIVRAMQEIDGVVFDVEAGGPDQQLERIDAALMAALRPMLHFEATPARILRTGGDRLAGPEIRLYVR